MKTVLVGGSGLASCYVVFRKVKGVEKMHHFLFTYAGNMGCNYERSVAPEMARIGFTEREMALFRAHPKCKETGHPSYLWELKVPIAVYEKIICA